MYSTKLKDERFSVDCIVFLGKVRIVQFVVDAGAMFTCCNYKLFDKSMQEIDLKECEVKNLGGFIEGVGVKFYKVSLSQFTIGNINLNKQNIWVTFDKRVRETVLGMDILQQVIFTVNPYNKKIYFCKDSDDYNNNFELLTA